MSQGLKFIIFVPISRVLGDVPLLPKVVGLRALVYCLQEVTERERESALKT